MLDGQQRLTTIWRALKGIDSIFFVSKKLDELDMDDDLLENWMGEISETKTDFRINIAMHEAMKFREIKGSKKKATYLKSILKEQMVYSQYEEDSDEAEHVFDLARELIELLWHFFKDEDICLQTKIKSNLSVFVKYFERANTASKPLNFVDIIVAKVFENFKLRPELTKLVKRCNKLSFIKKMNQRSKSVFENVVRMTAFLSGIEMASGKMLENLEAKHFKEHFSKSVECFISANELLAKYNLIHNSSDLPYPNMILPVMAFMSTMEKPNTNKVEPNQKEQIIEWFFRSGFTERYSKKAGEVLAKDSAILKSLGKNKSMKIFANANYISSFAPSRIQTESDLIKHTTKSGAIRRAFLCQGIFSSEGVRDWLDSAAVTKNQKTETHHIFPQKFVANGSNDWAKAHVHSIVNLIDITDSLNNKIKSKSPKIYLNGLENPDLTDVLGDCQIPTDVLEYDDASDMREFLEKRAAVIFPKIQPYLSLE